MSKQTYTVAGKERTAKLTDLKAIRAKCLDCSAGSTKEVRNCEHIKCPLYPYRLGTNPNRKGFKHSGSFKKKTDAAERVLEEKKKNMADSATKNSCSENSALERGKNEIQNSSEGV